MTTNCKFCKNRSDMVVTDGTTKEWLCHSCHKQHTDKISGVYFAFPKRQTTTMTELAKAYDINLN